MISSSSNISSRSLIDRIVAGGSWLSALSSAALLILVVVFLCREAGPALQRIGVGSLVSDPGWYPLSAQFNLMPMVLATWLVALGALLLAAPLGIASALFTRFYAPPVLDVGYRRLVELLAGIPSVVFGLWGLMVLVPLLSQFGGTGQGLLAATIVLGLMILPTIALTSDAALRAVPPEQLRGAAALGLGRWSVARRVALSSARPGIVTGLILALARALGETMAVLMVAGNVVQFPDSILAPVRTLTANMALELGYATADHRAALFISGLLLMVTVGILVALAEWQSEVSDGG